MKPKTARRILKKRAWEIAERKTALGGFKRWLGRLETKCFNIVVADKIEKYKRYLPQSEAKFSRTAGDKLYMVYERSEP